MRDIPGYEGLYGITSCGRVWSYRSKKFLKPQKQQNGYLYVNLYQNGKCKHYRIHRLVADAYLPNLKNKPCINHKDENKSNNALPNLEWATHKENNNYGTHKERVAKSLSKKVQCVETGEIFESIKEAQDFFKCGNHISECCRGKQKTCAGYHWRYYEDDE